MKNKLIIAAVCMQLIGCTSAGVSSSLSSGVLGCPSKDIKITDEEASVRGTHEWVAVCNGKKYVCSYVYGSNTNCAESKAQAQTISATDDCINRSRYNSTLVCPPK
ncbi:MAG: hypothetical protein ACXWAT_17290 [Methylobacter sp.]